MSTKKITALTELSAAPAATDMIPIVDVSDTTDAASGTTKKITATNVGKGIGIGAGNTSSEPVKIDTSTGVVGIGEDSPAQMLALKKAGDAFIKIESSGNNNYSGIFLTRESSAGTDRGAGYIRVESDTSVSTGLLEFGVGSNFGADSANTLMAISSTGKVGIGTTSPDELLEVESTTTSGAAIQIKSTATDGWPTIRFINDAREWRIYGSNGASYDAFQIYDHTATTTRLRIDTSGNILIGGSSTPTSSVGNLCLFNGTIPAASVADGVVLYAEDATGSSELKVRDEAGNVATLSPHNFELLGERSDPMAWSYSSKNAFVGKEVAVDMMKVIRALEKLTGEEYIKMRDIGDSEKLDWATEEKRKEDERKAEMSSYAARKVENDKEKADFDEEWGTLPTDSNTKAEVKAFLDEKEISYEDGVKEELLKKVPEKPELEEPEPEAYVKKSKPDWID